MEHSYNLKNEGPLLDEPDNLKLDGRCIEIEEKSKCARPPLPPSRYFCRFPLWPKTRIKNRPDQTPAHTRWRRANMLRCPLAQVFAAAPHRLTKIYTVSCDAIRH
jgi:hypothetical protein